MTQLVATAIAAGLRRSPSDSGRVLAGRPIHNPGHPDPLFGDDVWDLSGALRKLDTKTWTRAVFRWMTWVPDDERRRQALKEFAMACLTRMPHPRSRYRAELPAVATVHSKVRAMLRFARFLDGKPFVEVRQEDLDAYLDHLSATLAPASLAMHVQALQDYANSREHLITDPLRVEPWRNRSASKVAGYRPPLENTTERIPGPVVEPLLRWALFYVQIASVDLLAALEEIVAIDRRLADPPSEPRDARAAVQRVIERRRVAGLGMPASRGPSGTMLGREEPLRINSSAIAQAAGWHRDVLTTSVTAQVKQAVAELGLEDGTLETRLSPHPDTGEPWRPGLSRADLAAEINSLIIACYIVIAYLSGMRDDEVQSLEPGCCTTSRNGVGRLIYKVRSEVTKGHSGPVSETWVVLDETFQAVRVLERLQAIRGSRRLLSSTHGNAKHAVISSPDLSARLDLFRDHIGQLASHSDLPGIPLVAGQPWSLSPRQFRRTVAWYIANEPYGVVAGAIQYKHVSVRTFMGYAGESRSGFRAEIERERGIRGFDDFLVRMDGYQSGQRSVGPGGKRLNQTLEALLRQIGPLPGKVIDEPRYRAMIEHVAAQIHPGVHNDCFFNPERALCLTHQRIEDRTAPLLNRCLPTRCANSSFSLLHRPAWEAACRETTRALRDSRLSVLQREALEQELVLMEGVLRLIDEATA